MSSAILYLAIIAIWLCVLIPRWLKRDSAHGAAFSEAAATADVPATPAEASGGGSGRAAGGTERAPDGIAAADGEGAAPRPATPAGPATAPLSADEARRRMMAGRRRLLGMLAALEVAAIALAFLGLVALWVVIPPSIMLAGYVLLLREAAAADSERANREAEAAAHARERERAARARARAAQRATPTVGTPLAARFAAAPVPADYEESGRDFAPGLAGKYTTSNADYEPVAEDYTYEPPRLRAVGD